jgi:hypothetical protein
MATATMGGPETGGALFRNAGAGLREIARKMNIPEGTVLAHAKRKGWTRQIHAAKQEAKPMQSNAITPIQALATTLNERKDKSRLHLSKYVVDASKRAADSNGNLKIARQVRDVTVVKEAVWPEDLKGEGGLHLHMLSLGPTQVKIGREIEDEENQETKS